VINIVVDSTADLPPEAAARQGIAIVPILIQIGGATLRDGVDIDKDTLYRRLVEDQTLPQTAAPSVGMFEEAFRRATDDGSAALAITLGATLSSTHAAAQQAAALLEGRQVACFDSQTTSAPMAYLAEAAAEAAAAGQGMEAIIAELERMRARLVLLVALDTLHYLEKGGRIGRMRALLGTMLSVKPVLEVRAGEVVPVEQVRTWKRVPPRLVELAAGRGAYARLTALYTTDRAQAEHLADLCAGAGLMPRERIDVVQAGAALGVHVGPGALGLAGLVHG
jgi:DegV family protein with EDD domain